MKLKKFIFSFILAICLIVPAMFVLTGCDDKDEITKIDIPTVTVSTFTYDGNEKTLAIAENANYTITGNKATNAGSYTAKIKLKNTEKYVWADGTTIDKKIKWSITKASSSVGFKETYNPSKVYDGNAVAVPTAEDITIFGDGVIVYKWFRKSGETYVEMEGNTRPTAAGEYKVSFAVAEGTNHTSAVSNEKEFTISKKQLTIHWPTQAEFEASNNNTGAIYDGKTKTTLIGNLIRQDTFYGGDIEGDDVGLAITSGAPGDMINCTEEGFAINYQLKGDDKNNYIIAGETSTDSKVTSPTYHILPKPLTITNVAVADKYFDSTAAVTSVTYNYTGILEADLAHVGISTTGTYDSVAAGNNISVTVNFTLSGTKAGNYSIISEVQITGKILNGIQFNVNNKDTSGSSIILYGELISGTISTGSTVAIVDVNNEQILATAIVQEIQVDETTETLVNESTTGDIGLFFEPNAFGSEVVAGATIVTYNTYY